MPQIDDLEDDGIDGILRRLRRLETAAPVGFTEVNRGALRVLSAAGFYVGGAASAIVDGLLRVTGILEVIGLLNITGTTTQTGPYVGVGDESHEGNESHSGELTYTGPEHHEGDEEHIGTITVKGDLDVIDDGKVNVGDALVLDPTVSSGAIVFSNGGQIFTDDDELEMYLGNSAVSVEDTKAVMVNGSSSITVKNDGITLYALVFMPGLPDKP